MIRKVLTLITITCILVSCAKKITVPLTAEVNIVNEDKHKTIELRSVGFGKNIEEAIFDSEHSAILAGERESVDKNYSYFMN